jgi:hypothetical protein
MLCLRYRILNYNFVLHSVDETVTCTRQRNTIECVRYSLECREAKYLCRYRDGLRAGRPGFNSRQGQEIFYSPQRPGQLWGPPSLLSNGVPEASSPGVWQGQEADHSPPSSAEVNNGEAISSLPHMSSWRGA